MSKRLSSDRSPNPLPGFEFTVAPSRPGDVDLSDEKRFTGEILFRDHPDVFKSVAASFFMDGLSVRATAARYRVSVNTVRAIRDMALESSSSDAGRAAFFIKSKADRLHGIVRNRALEVIYDRLCDPDESRKITVDTLVKLAEIDQKESHPAVTSKDEIIDVDEFDDILNGLDGEKKSADDLVDDSAACDDGSDDDLEREASDSASGIDGSETAECSTESTNQDCRSFELSGSHQCLQGVRDDLCNPLCNSVDDGRMSVDDGRMSADVASADVASVDVASVGGASAGGASADVASVGGASAGGSVGGHPDAASTGEMDPGGGGRPGASARGESD